MKDSKIRFWEKPKIEKRQFLKERGKVHKKQTRFSFLSSIIIWSLPFVVSGSISPKALERAVVECDYSLSKSLGDQLLINIARFHHP
ncbi:MAG: hypothetical protein OET79_01415 [Nitrospirota bacterium]|nr:hypothetical protein [Nitrospirota bacterium]